MLGIKIREGAEKDVEEIASLLIRLKRLNGEFDPLLKVRGDALEKAKELARKALKERDDLVLVAEKKGKVVGLINATLMERQFYEPRLEGAIIDFYVLPEFRRTGLGKRIMNEAVKKLKSRGAEIITAEFPSQNRIASSFYEKLGFRAIVSIYAKQRD